MQYYVNAFAIVEVLAFQTLKKKKKKRKQRKTF